MLLNQRKLPGVIDWGKWVCTQYSNQTEYTVANYAIDLNTRTSEDSIKSNPVKTFEFCMSQLLTRHVCRQFISML